MADSPELTSVPDDSEAFSSVRQSTPPPLPIACVPSSREVIIQEHMTQHPLLATLAGTLAIPIATATSIFNNYEQFVVANAQQVIATESLARNATYILPSLHQYLE